jgi:hypothetical protein
MGWDASLLHEGYKVVPSDRVERFGDVQFKQQSCGFGAVEAPDEIPHVEEVIMDASLFNEGALGCGNELTQQRR